MFWIAYLMQGTYHTTNTTATYCAKTLTVDFDKRDKTIMSEKQNLMRYKFHKDYLKVELMCSLIQVFLFSSCSVGDDILLLFFCLYWFCQP